MNMGKSSNVIKRLNANVIVRNVVLAVCAVIVLVFVVSILLNMFTRHNDYKSVPDFSGMSIGQAEQAAKEGALKIEINDSLYVAGYDGGVILDQMPKPGNQVKSGRRIFVTVNAYGQKMVRVPYVTGLSLRQAKNNLQVAGLEIDRIVYREDIATNYVLEEQYNGSKIGQGSRLEAPQGSGVTLIVGLNPNDMLPTMPRLIGLSLAEAKSRLWDAGLNVGRLDFDADITLMNRNEARVYAQTPAQSLVVDPGAVVDLRLTLDDAKIEKAGKDADAAAKAIMDAIRQARAEAEEDGTLVTE